MNYVENQREKCMVLGRNLNSCRVKRLSRPYSFSSLILFQGSPDHQNVKYPYWYSLIVEFQYVLHSVGQTWFYIPGKISVSGHTFVTMINGMRAYENYTGYDTLQEVSKLNLPTILDEIFTVWKMKIGLREELWRLLFPQLEPWAVSYLLPVSQRLSHLSHRTVALSPWLSHRAFLCHPQWDRAVMHSPCSLTFRL